MAKEKNNAPSKADINAMNEEVNLRGKALESQEELNSLLQEEARITQTIKSLREKLSKLTDTDSKSESERLKIGFEIQHLSEKQNSLFEKKTKMQRQSSDLAKKDFDLQTKQSKQTEKDVKLGETNVKNQQMHRKLVGDIRKGYGEMISAAEKLQKNAAGNKKLQEAVSMQVKSIAGTQGLMNHLADKYKNNIEEIKYLTSDVMSMSRSSLSVLADMQENEKKMNVHERSLLNLTTLELDIENARAAVQEMGNSLSEKELESLNAYVTEAETRLELAKAHNKVIEEAQNTYESHKTTLDALDSGLTKTFDKMGSLVQKIPGGSFLMKSLGFDKMVNNIKKNMGGAITNVMDGLKKGGKEGFAQAIQGVHMFGRALLSGPQVAIFGIIAAIALIAEMFGEADKAISETQKELGGTKKEAIASHEAAHKLALEMNLVGINSAEVVKSMGMVSEMMGGIKVNAQSMKMPEMAQMVKDTTLLSEKFGLSKEEIENVHSMSVLTGKSMGTLAGEAIGVAGGVMRTKDAVKLLGGISKDVVVSFKGGTKELIAAAAKAKMLGMDLKRVKDIGMGMLEIEDSLGKEMEARVLYGKNINLDAARAAALNGNVAKVQEELLKQAGSLDEFKKRGPIAQKALADAMGMTVEEMTNMLTKAEEMNKLGISAQLQNDMANMSAKQRSAEYQKQADILRAQGKTNEADLAERKAAEESSASTTEKISDIFTKLKETALQFVTPLIESVHAMLDLGGGTKDVQTGFSGIIDSIKPVMNVLKIIGEIIGGIWVGAFKNTWAIIGGIYEGLKPVIDTVTGIFNSLGSVNKQGEQTASIFSMVSDAVNFLGPVLKVVGKLIGIVIGQPFKLVAELISGIIKLFKGDFKGALADLGMAAIRMFYEPFAIVIDAIKVFFPETWKMFEGWISGIYDMIVKKITGAFDWIADKAKGALSFLGLGGDDKEKKSQSQAAQSTVKGGEMPKAAGGGEIKGGGLVLVGEKGPELVQLPTGANVASTGAGDQVQAILSALGLGGVSGKSDEKQTEKKSVPDLLQSILDFMVNVAGPAYIAMAATGDVLKELGKFLGVGKKGKDGKEEKSPLEQLVDASKETAAAIKEFVYGKESKDGKKEKSPLEQLVDASKETASLMKDFVYGKDIELKDSKGNVIGRQKQQSVFEKLLEYQDNMIHILSDILLIMERSTNLSAKKIKEKEAAEKDAIENSFIGKATGAKWEEPGRASASGPSPVSTPQIPFLDLLFGRGTPGGNGGINNTGGGGGNMANVEKKLDTLITLFSQAANQPTVIKFGDKVVDEIKTQLNFKKAYNIGTDNTYGRSLQN